MSAGGDISTARPVGYGDPWGSSSPGVVGDCDHVSAGGDISTASLVGYGDPWGTATMCLQEGTSALQAQWVMVTHGGPRAPGWRGTAPTCPQEGTSALQARWVMVTHGGPRAPAWRGTATMCPQEGTSASPSAREAQGSSWAPTCPGTLQHLCCEGSASTPGTHHRPGQATSRHHAAAWYELGPRAARGRLRAAPWRSAGIT